MLELLHVCVSMCVCVWVCTCVCVCVCSWTNEECLVDVRVEQHAVEGGAGELTGSDESPTPLHVFRDTTRCYVTRGVM